MNRTIYIIAISAMTGCSTVPRESESGALFQQGMDQRTAAKARALQSGDNRPYPDGWPSGTLPLNGDPTIVKKITIGMTMPEVTNIMGRGSESPIIESRTQLISSLQYAYERVNSTNKLPDSFEDVEVSIPKSGRFTQWHYQGFPTTAHWIVIVFAAPDNQPDAELRVVCRGIFVLGCF